MTRDEILELIADIELPKDFRIVPLNLKMLLDNRDNWAKKIPEMEIPVVINVLSICKDTISVDTGEPMDIAMMIPLYNENTPKDVMEAITRAIFTAVFHETSETLKYKGINLIQPHTKKGFNNIALNLDGLKQEIQDNLSAI